MKEDNREEMSFFFKVRLADIAVMKIRIKITGGAFNKTQCQIRKVSGTLVSSTYHQKSVTLLLVSY